MSLLIYIAALLFLLGAVCLSLRILLGGPGHFRNTGVWVVVCPETKESAIVELRPPQACLSRAVEDHIRLKDCSRWPRHADCERGCIRQIESGQPELLVTREDRPRR